MQYTFKPEYSLKCNVLTTTYNNSYNKLSKIEYINSTFLNLRYTQELIEKEFNKSISILKSLYRYIKDIKLEIDRLFYSLYDLSSDEISIVENIFQ